MVIFFFASTLLPCTCGSRNEVEPLFVTTPSPSLINAFNHDLIKLRHSNNAVNKSSCILHCVRRIYVFFNWHLNKTVLITLQATSFFSYCTRVGHAVNNARGSIFSCFYCHYQQIYLQRPRIHATRLLDFLLFICANSIFLLISIKSIPPTFYMLPASICVLYFFVCYVAFFLSLKTLLRGVN